MVYFELGKPFMYTLRRVLIVETPIEKLHVTNVHVRWISDSYNDLCQNH